MATNFLPSMRALVEDYMYGTPLAQKKRSTPNEDKTVRSSVAFPSLLSEERQPDSAQLGNASSTYTKHDAGRPLAPGALVDNRRRHHHSRCVHLICIDGDDDASCLARLATRARQARLSGKPSVRMSVTTTTATTTVSPQPPPPYIGESRPPGKTLCSVIRITLG